MRNMFKGVICPVVTAFDPYGEIDYAAQGLHVERLIEHGIDGILFCGSIGEFPSLCLDEKKAFFEWAVKKVDGRAWVLAGTGGTNVGEAVELTKHCKLAGANGAVVISPYYFQLDERALHSYYAAVAKTGLPIVLYNFPERTKVSLSAGLVRNLAGEFENIVGIKDTVDSMSHTRELIDAVLPGRGDFCVLSGYDEYFIPNLFCGGAGVLSGLTNIAPGLFMEIKAAFKESDFGKLRGLQLRLNGLMKIYSAANPFISAIKYAVHTIIPEMGCSLREPFAPLTRSECGTIDGLLEKFL